MAEVSQIERVGIDKLIPYINNAKIHSDSQVTKIASSIREFGFVNPVLIDKSFNVIAGHGRIKAAEKLGLDEVPCVYVEGLTEAQRKAYILADNKLGEFASWDLDMITNELEGLQSLDFDVELTGFELERLADDWFETRTRNDTSRQEGNEEYNEFLEKFEAKKTTDDCYTPDNVYEAVADWVAKEYKLDKAAFIRPFKPGGDYQKEDYTGKVVVDNPPFSILSEIRKWYNEHNVKFFLFAPSVSAFSGGGEFCAICTGASVTYENNANVSTSFSTNLETSLARTAPELYRVIAAADKENTKGKEIPKYKYPAQVMTAAMLSYLSKYGQEFRVEKNEAAKISELDAQKESGKSIYGSGYLISEKAAAEKAAAEKAARENAEATVWELSARELEIIRTLG